MKLLRSLVAAMALACSSAIAFAATVTVSGSHILDGSGNPLSSGTLSFNGSSLTVTAGAVAGGSTFTAGTSTLALYDASSNLIWSLPATTVSLPFNADWLVVLSSQTLTTTHQPLLACATGAVAIETDIQPNRAWTCGQAYGRVQWVTQQQNLPTNQNPVQSGAGSCAGDLSGTYPNCVVSRIAGQTPGNIITHNASEFALAGQTGGSPSGSAGGDLTGNYPSPTVSKIGGVTPGNIISHSASDFDAAGVAATAAANALAAAQTYTNSHSSSGSTPSAPSPQAAYTSARYYALTNAAYNLEAFSDGSGSYWAAGGSFLNQGVFADDLTLAVIAAPDVFSSHTADLENIIAKFEAAANGSGEMPVGVSSSGAAVTFWSSDDQKHNHASGDAQLMLPQLEFEAYLMSGSTAGISAHIAGLATALGTIQTDSSGLLVVSAGDRWMPWLFEETAQHTGHVTMGSLWLARDYQVMAQMYTAIGNASAASTWGSKYSTIMANLSGTGSPLWNSTVGMYMMDDGALSTNVDVDGSALACYFGFASAAQCTSISNWLVTNLSAINRGGFLRQSNAEFAACGGINSSGSPVDNTGGLCAGGVYQSGGVWGVQLGWVLYTIGLTSPSTAQSLLSQALIGPGGNPRIEWYPWTGTGGGSNYNLESTMGFYDFARKGYAPQTGGSPSSSSSAYPALQQVGNSPLYLWNNNSGISATSTPASPNSYTGFVASAFGITSHSSSTPFGFMYSSGTDGLVHFGDGTNDTFTFSPSTKIVNFVNPPTGIGASTSAGIAYGTPTLDATSLSGTSIVNNTDWPAPTDQTFVLVYTPGAAVAAGSTVFVVDFGKEWTNASGAHPNNPLCQFGMAGNGAADGVNWGLSGVGFKSISIAPTAALTAGHTYIALGTCNAPNQVAAGTY